MPTNSLTHKDCLTPIKYATSKRWLWLIWFFFGQLGAHRYALGKLRSGFLIMNYAFILTYLILISILFGPTFPHTIFHPVIVEAYFSEMSDSILFIRSASKIGWYALICLWIYDGFMLNRWVAKMGDTGGPPDH